MTFEAGIAGVDIPRRQQLPGPSLVVELGKRLAGELHELPAPAPGTARHGGRRPGRVAHLQVDRVEDARLVEDHVDDQPVVEETEVVYRQARQRAHRAVRSVTADDERRAHGGAVGAPHDDVVAQVVEGGHLDPASEPDLGQLGHATFQERLEFGLAEHRRRRPSGRPVTLPAEAQQRVAVRVAPFVDVGGFADRPEIVADPACLEDPAHFVVEVDGAGQRVRIGPPFEHGHGVTSLGEQDRERQASRPGADDGDVGSNLGHHPTGVMPTGGADVPTPRSGRTGGCRPIRRR